MTQKDKNRSSKRVTRKTTTSCLYIGDLNRLIIDINRPENIYLSGLEIAIRQIETAKIYIYDLRKKVPTIAKIMNKYISLE